MEVQATIEREVIEMSQNVKIRVRDGKRHSRREGGKAVNYEAGDVFKGTERELERFGDKLERAGNRATLTGAGGGSRTVNSPAGGSSGQTARASRAGTATQGADQSASEGGDSGSQGDGEPGAGDGGEPEGGGEDEQ